MVAIHDAVLGTLIDSIGPMLLPLPIILPIVREPGLALI